MKSKTQLITLFGILGISAAKYSSGSKNKFEKSKVLDSKGDLLTVYHGSPVANIEAFDLDFTGKNSGSMGHYGFGIYFTPEKRIASGYGRYLYKANIDLKNPFYATSENYIKLMNRFNNQDLKRIYSALRYDTKSFINELRRVGKVNAANLVEKMVEENMSPFQVWDYLFEQDDLIVNIQKQVSSLNQFIHAYLNYLEHFNPIDETGYNQNYGERSFPNDWGINPRKIYGFTHYMALHYLTHMGTKSRELTNQLIELGFDGVIYGDEYVAFFPEQINILEIIDTDEPNP